MNLDGRGEHIRPARTSQLYNPPSTGQGQFHMSQWNWVKVRSVISKRPRYPPVIEKAVIRHLKCHPTQKVCSRHSIYRSSLYLPYLVKKQVGFLKASFTPQFLFLRSTTLKWGLWNQWGHKLAEWRIIIINWEKQNLGIRVVHGVG